MINNKLDKMFESEEKYCEEMEFEKNEHGVFIYKSTNGFSSINLACILTNYRQWLIDKGLHAER